MMLVGRLILGLSISIWTGMHKLSPPPNSAASDLSTNASRRMAKLESIFFKLHHYREREGKEAVVVQVKI